MIKKWHVYVGFFTLLFAGYFLYLSTQDEFSRSTLPVISNVQPFSFTNQDGRTISERDVEDKVYVTEFFFTTCKGICPRINANMRRVYDEYKADSNFMILSHTSNPEIDLVPRLKQYERKMVNGKLEKNDDGTYKIDYDSTIAARPGELNHNWNFVTGDKASLYKMARQSYMIDNNKPDTSANGANDFVHTQFFALVDKQGRVRQIYDALKEDEVQKLLKDIDVLLKEKNQNRSL